MSSEALFPRGKPGGVVIDCCRALRVLEEECARARSGTADTRWETRVTELRAACDGASKTHIAALATALLARATDIRANPFALKAKANVAGAYSARRLAKDVLAANAARLEIDIGVTGREPLNNQPYFRYDVISRDMDIKGNARRALTLVCDALDALQQVTTEEEARAALRAFLKVSRRRSPSVRHRVSAISSATALADALAVFVGEDSEGGKRAQGVSAGILDVVFGPSRVLTSRINDPDRRFPGDVGVLTEDISGLERALEVRDKPVCESDLDFMVEKCSRAGVAWAGVLAVDPGQGELVTAGPSARAQRRGVELVVFIGWRGFVEQALFWSGLPALSAAANAHLRVFERLREVEVCDAGLEAWNSVAGDHAPT